MAWTVCELELSKRSDQRVRSQEKDEAEAVRTWINV